MECIDSVSLARLCKNAEIYVESCAAFCSCNKYIYSFLFMGGTVAVRCISIFLGGNLQLKFVYHLDMT
jgi:hypothetical protein